MVKNYKIYPSMSIGNLKEQFGRERFKTVPYRSSELRNLGVRSRETDSNDDGLQIFPEVVNPRDHGDDQSNP